MSESLVTLSWGAATDRGLRRAVNEDSFVAEQPLFLVADGMGGHAAGSEASGAALAAFERLRGRFVDAREVEDAVWSAREAVSGLGEGNAAPGTTLTGAVVCRQNDDDYWLVVNIGDSRTYRLNGDRFTQVSVDHSAVQELVDRGEIDEHAAESHPHRNVVTRAIGAGSTGAPDFWLLPIEDGDRIMACSDGLTKELSQGEIHSILAAEASPQGAATRLVHEALLRGGRDNVTVVVVDAQGAPEPDDDETGAFEMRVPTHAGETDPLDEDTHPAESSSSRGEGEDADAQLHTR